MRDVDTALPSAGSSFWIRPALLDKLEILFLLSLWSIFLVRIELAGNPWAYVVLLSESAVLLFLLIRRSTQKVSLRLGDWLLAMSATCAPLLVLPGAALVPALVPLGLFLAGLGNALQIWAKFTLRRSFGMAPANRGIKISGPYRVVRHPMYAGYALMHLSSLILMFHPMNLLIYLLGWTAQILRLKAEERFLSADPDYADYMAKVRWRLCPGLF